MTKDKQEEAKRHAQRNYVVKEVRNQLVTHQGCSFTEADILIGRIWGVGDRKIREIVRSESFSAVSAADDAGERENIHSHALTRCGGCGVGYQPVRLAGLQRPHSRYRLVQCRRCCWMYVALAECGNGDEVDIRIVRGTRRGYSLWTPGRDG